MGIFVEGRIFTLIILLVISVSILYSMYKGKQGFHYPLRSLPGLEAIKEVIGRCTEMGKPVHFSAGIGDLRMYAAPMLAGISALREVAKISAKYATDLIVTVSQPDVFPLSDETAKQGALEAGRPEQYKSENVRFLSPDQWAYGNAVVGIMEREQVAGNIIIGHFAAECMVIAEAAAARGVQQVAGTTNLYQIPFLIASCDYMLIGEEIFAGDAYFTKDNQELGVLRGQDIAKLVGVGFLLIGVIFAAFGKGNLIKSILSF